MVGHMLASSHGNLDSHRTRLHIDNCISPPRLLSIHRLSLDFFHIGLHFTAAFFIRNQDAITARCHNKIFTAHAKNRDIQFIDHIGVFTGLIQNSFALGLIRHDFSHHVPCADILPGTAVTEYLNAGFFLDYCIVEADFSQGIILIEQVAVIFEINHAVCFVLQIS